MLSSIVFVKNLTADNIAYQDNKEQLELINKIFPEAMAYVYDEVNEVYTIYNASHNKLGFVFYAQGVSYYGSPGMEEYKVGRPMTILVGLIDKETIAGIVVTKQNEDEPYWTWIVNRNFFEQFNDLKIADCYLRGQDGAVDAVSMATLSSQSVIDIVRKEAIKKSALIS